LEEYPLMKKTDDSLSSEAGRYASVNGLNMYYEIHGSGEPLVLLHGAFSAIGSSESKKPTSLATAWEPVLPCRSRSGTRM
jgi:hypothetical protein